MIAALVFIEYERCINCRLSRFHARLHRNVFLTDVEVSTWEKLSDLSVR